MKVDIIKPTEVKPKGFKPSPTTVVRLVDGDGKLVELRSMNRRQRRRLGVKRSKRDGMS